jgi:hypothetical protein
LQCKSANQFRLERGGRARAQNAAPRGRNDDHTPDQRFRNPGEKKPRIVKAAGILAVPSRTPMGEFMSVKARLAMGFAVVAALSVAPAALAHQSTGAIFTTIADGSEVNYNQYPSKDAVYLDGGPGPGAPLTAAGLTDGTYVFQVTDPSGKTLLSTDKAGCREIVVSGGVITGAGTDSVTMGCAHALSLVNASGNQTVQLIPYNDTPNPGGVYKAWVTFLSDYTGTFGCNLNTVDCNAKGAFHGFGPPHSKTDNFKVKQVPIREIDTRFFQDVDHDGVYTDGTDVWIDGEQVTWTDTLGASNIKSSYLNLALDVHHEAHVEGVENGTHKIAIAAQNGCTNIGNVSVNGVSIGSGPMTVSVNVSASDKTLSTQIWVACE